MLLTRYENCFSQTRKRQTIKTSETLPMITNPFIGQVQPATFDGNRPQGAAKCDVNFNLHRATIRHQIHIHYAESCKMLRHNEQIMLSNVDILNAAAKNTGNQETARRLRAKANEILEKLNTRNAAA